MFRETVRRKWDVSFSGAMYIKDKLDGITWYLIKGEPLFSILKAVFF